MELRSRDVMAYLCCPDTGLLITPNILAARQVPCHMFFILYPDPTLIGSLRQDGGVNPPFFFAYCSSFYVATNDSLKRPCCTTPLLIQSPSCTFNIILSGYRVNSNFDGF